MHLRGRSRGGGGVLKAKFLEQCMKKNWNFLGGEVQNKQPSMGGEWIFSGTTHSNGILMMNPYYATVKSMKTDTVLLLRSFLNGEPEEHI